MKVIFPSRDYETGSSKIIGFVFNVDGNDKTLMMKQLLIILLSHKSCFFKLVEHSLDHRSLLYALKGLKMDDGLLM